MDVSFIYEYRFWLAVFLVTVLYLVPIRWSRWLATLICAIVFVHEGQVFSFFSALLIGAWASRMESRYDQA